MPIFRVIDLECEHEYNTSMTNSTSEDGWEEFPQPAEVGIYVTGPGLHNWNDSVTIAHWWTDLKVENDVVHVNLLRSRNIVRARSVFSSSLSTDGESFVHGISVHVSARRELFTNQYVVCTSSFVTVRSNRHPKGQLTYILNSSPTHLHCLWK